MNTIEKAGWVGYALGVVTTSTVIAITSHLNQPEPPEPEQVFTKHVVTNTITVEPDCYEDEVYVWFGDFPDDVEWHCVPLDSLIGGDQ